MNHYYRAKWEWFCEPSGQCYWRAPGGNNVGVVDLRSNTQAGKSGGPAEGFGVFAYAEPQTIEGADYLGTDESVVADLIWTKLTTEADPKGKTGPKPLTGRVGKEVALYIAGKKIKSEGFTAAHRQRTVDVFQEDYRENADKYSKDLLQKWVGAKMQEIYGEMSDEKAELLVPAEHKKGGKLWKIPATTISDPFTNTDGTALESHNAAGFSWTKLSGNSMMIQSNKLQRNATTGHGDRDYRAESDLSTDDMYAKAVVGSLGSDFDCSVAVRFSTSARTHYQTEWGNGFRRISKFVAGAHSVLQSDGNGNSVGDTLEVRVNDTTIQAFRNSAQVLSNQTDTGITGHLRAGIAIWHDQSTWDTFEAGDLSAGSPSASVSPSSSPSPSVSPSSSPSPSVSPSASVSPSSSPSPSVSPSASVSPSSSPSPSVSPSSSPSPSVSPSASVSPSSSPSPSVSPSASVSPSSSPSPSVSPSASVSPSSSPSSSNSPSPSPSSSASASVSPSDVDNGISKKRFLYKIYDSSGTFLTTWNDVISEPEFHIDINGGFSELVVRLARPESQYDEGVSVDYENRLKLWVFDVDAPLTGVLIYSGKISRYVPQIIGNREIVEVSFLSHWWQLNQLVLESAGDTEVTYTTQAPDAILKDALDKFTAAGGILDYDGSSTDATGTTVTYKFNTATYQEVLLKCLDLAPYDWYIRTGPDDIIYFEQKSATANHILTLGKEISEYYPEKRTENIVNTIYFVGGGSPKLYKKYTDAASVTAYGTKAIKYIDERVTASGTSDKIKDRIFDNLSEPEIRITAKIMDNNGDAYANSRGYDIESLKVGQTVQIRNATAKSNNFWDEVVWDVDSWDYDITNAASQVLQIMKVQYHPDYAIIELSNKLPDIVKRIEEINRQLVDTVTADNPATPS